MQIKTNITKNYFTVLVITAVLYLLSCASGPLFQDSGMIQYRVWYNDIQGSLGLALSHPLFYILAIATKCIPLGSFAYKINLLSAFAGAVTVANLFLFIRLWLNKTFPAVIGAVSLALSWTFWQHASVAETYTLYTAILMAELVLLLQYTRTGKVGWLYLLAFANGLAIADHMLASIPLACYLVFIVWLVIGKKISIRQLLLLAAIWIVGAAPYEYLIIKELISTGDLAATINSALFGKSWSDAALNMSLSLSIVVQNFAFMVYSFPTPNILLIFVGIYAALKIVPERKLVIFLFSFLVLFLVFAFRYTVVDRYAFFIPFYCIAAIFLALGADVIITKIPRKGIAAAIMLFALLSPVVYAIVPFAMQRANIKLPTKREIPFRNDYTFFLTPWQSLDNSPALFAGAALKDLPADSIIIADGTTVYPLWYAQTVNGDNPDVKILSRHGSYQSPMPFPTDSEFDDLIKQGRIFVVTPEKDYCPVYLFENYDFVQAGVIYKVEQ